ncbi:OmpP1/FadL family transporter [Pelobacter propionicus]|uniref:Membrane protein involved in aromatic hydrocarbon degradation n=1 Tax=Pelobacter propionicus (strain DSM 2379 / NBRC 103807 / OttBd1) TaxID=338966 RepID=A1ANV6_PELPD|nr:outer membrane protein transport protein [Pelobacter propionicus]ABK99026.1 membrane protein involved in aromatic hydrocarbon degradation [Pelobacter propionicus DSM 2379]
MDSMGRRVVVAALLCAATVTGGVHPALGSGFGIFTQGASALGQADAVVAHGDGPSALFFNPAQINGLAGTQLEFGTTLIFPHREYKDSSGDVSHTKDSVFYPSSFYLTHAFNDSISAGLAVFNPFGLGTDWGGDWPGRYIATTSKITTYNINPVVSWRIAPFLSIAAGLDIVQLDATFKNKIFTPSGDVKQKFTGDGTGLGYNLGLFIDAGKGITIGASYRSEVKIDIDGKDEFSPAVYPDMDGKTSLKLPQQVLAGVAWQASDRLVVETGMRWEDWRSFKQLRISLDQPGGGSTVATYPRNWHSTFAVNAGGKYRFNDSLSIMAGYLYGWNPVPDSTFEPAIPDSDSHLFCLGGELRRGSMTLSLGYGYQLQKGRSKSTNQYGSVANGDYDSDLHLLALSLGYRF